MMKMSQVLAFGVLSSIGFTATASPIGVDFQTFNIRNSSGSIVAPWDANMSIVENAAGTGFAAITPLGGQKVGYGTSFFDGVQVNDIQTVNFTKVSGKENVIPYLNFWVTDGTHFAIISSENEYRGTDFATRTEWKVFETAFPTVASPDALNWLLASGTASVSSQYLMKDGLRATLSDLANNVVLGSPDFPGVYSTIGTGAPRANYGFNVIFGDTQANFVGSQTISNLTMRVNGTDYAAAVPLPAAVWAGMSLLAGLGMVRKFRNRRSQEV